MSFGFGVGDVIAVSSLARSIWGRFRDASDQFNVIQNEVANLCLVLDDSKTNLSGLQLTDKQAEDISKLMGSCRSVLNDIDKLIRKNENLGAESPGLGPKTHRAWKKLKWDSATVNELRDRMVSNVTYLTAFNISLASRASRATNDKVDGISEDVKNLKLNQNQQEREVVLEWLSPLNFAPQQSDLSSRRQEGTGLWLLESQEFQEWKEKDRETLVCQGMPGAGKTMLASLVIDHLQQFSTDNEVTTTYLYCDYRRQDEQTPLNLIASLTKQLLQHQDSVSQDVIKIYQLHREKKTRPSFEEMLQMIGSLKAHSSRLYIIVDALDELRNAGQVRQTLIGHLRRLQKLYQFNLMTTSRYIPSLDLEFHQPLCMDIRASVEDVRRYVEGHFLDLPSCVRKSLGLQEIIAGAIVDAVEGMFLLAQLHMDSLRDKTSPKLIKKALEILPKGSNALDLAYDGAMQRIEGQMEGFRLRAKQLLGWLTYSERLMTVKEVQHALAIEPGTPELDEDNLSDVNEIVALCAGLIIIDEETQIIRLVHYTTQEYFRRNGETLLACAQQDMATSCLTYLLYEKFGDGWVFDVDQSLYGWIDARLRRYPFLGYAARYWATHASVCGQRNVKALTMSFVKDHRRVSSASQAILALDEFWLFDNIDETKSRAPLSAMHFVAYLGHEETISELLSHGFDADAKDSFHQTPLWWAASQGHEAVVSLLLLQSHVNVNDRGLTSSDGYGRDTSATPLSIAAAGGKDKIVKLLIQREDVDVNLPNTFSESPLSVATRGGYVTVVELLLTRRDIDVNSRNKMGKTSLCIAARYGADDIAQQLLEQKNIQVNLADMDRLTPLAWAASGGKEKIMKALLARSDIEVNRQDHWGRTPLFSAVETKNEALVKLLLSHSDIDVNRRNSAGRTALHIAAVWGYAPLVKLLTSRTDIEVNSKDESGSTAMHQAAKEGQPATVELLLGCVGIDVNLEDVYGCTLLHKAVEECGPLTVKDIPWFDDRSDEEAKQECEAVVAMLLGYVGIEVNPKDYEGKTPLATAVKFHQPAVVRLLCAHPDVDLDPRDNEGRDVFALIEEEKEQPSAFEEEVKARTTLELDECKEILRTAIETRSRNEPQTLETVPA